MKSRETIDEDVLIYEAFSSQIRFFIYILLEELFDKGIKEVTLIELYQYIMNLPSEYDDFKLKSAYSYVDYLRSMEMAGIIRRKRYPQRTISLVARVRTTLEPILIQ